MSQKAQIAEEFRRYAYSVSHDVSAPVRAMVEFSKLLAAEDMDSLSEDCREYLSLIIENGQKLQVMMEGLLDYSRVNTLATPFEDVDLNKVINAVLFALEGRIRNAHAVVEVDWLPIVKGDEEQLRLLFHVLLDNALKFQPSGNIPNIHIYANKGMHGCTFCITDNGIGIPPRHSKIVFDLFKRLHTDEEYKGVGIGLTLAKKIVERHGGVIDCSGHLPAGTVITFNLNAAGS